jgi:anion-transporting  ArsA/GET3 family ATPase
MKNAGLLEKRFITVTGKGGVGKSAVSAALGIAMSRLGRRVLVASMHRNDGTAGFFGAAAEPGEPFPVLENLWAVNVTPRSSLREYGMLVLRFEMLYRAVFEDRLVKYLLEALPSLEELVMFGKVWHHTQEAWKDGTPRFDAVIMDCQATGHAISMLSLPGTIVKAAPPGPLKARAQDMHAMLTQAGGTALCIVTTPEDMPVNEAAMLLEANRLSIGIPEAHLAVNRLIIPPFTRGEIEGAGAAGDGIAAAAIRCALNRVASAEAQAPHLERAERELMPPSVRLPEIRSGDFGLDEAGVLAEAILRECGGERARASG